MATVKTLLIDKNSDNFDAKNKFNTLILEGISYDDIKSMKINDEDDLLIIETEDREIVIDNYKKVRYITTDEITLGIPHPKTTDIIKEALVDNTDNEITDDDRKKLKLSGTNYNDKINAINYDVPQDKKNKDKGLTINAGDGNDEITGTLGNDTITGGEGTNTIVVKGDFGKDTVVLTKGETLILDLSDYEFDSIEDIDFDASDKKNFIINIKDNMNIGGTLILKNYTKQNLLGTKVLINIGDEDNMINLNTLDIFEYGKDDFSKGVFKGTRFSETIDASGFTSALGKKNKGVTIDGGEGYNIIYGTNGFNDTIKGGNDGNDITAGDGNKTITTGSGDDKITITGDGTHTIKAGTGENDIEIKGDGKTTITTGKDKDVINIENYESTNTINVGDGENEITVKGDATTTIKSGKDNDTINISNDSTASATIYAGKGNNTININNSDTFGNVILTEEKVNATNTIAFLYEFDKDYYLVKNGNDLIIKHGNAPDYMGEEDDLEHFTGEESSLTLKEFFKYNSKYATYKFKVNGEDKTYDELKDLTNGLWIVGKSTIRGTNEADNIHALGKSANAIYAGKGDDEIYGNGKSSIYFFEGDGHDTVMYSGNTLVFDKNTDIRFERDLDPEAFTKEGLFSYTDCAKLYYGDKGDHVYLYNVDAETDRETYIQIGNKKRLLSTLVKSKGIDGTDLREKEDNKTITGSDRGVDIINVEGDNCTVNALNGNNRIDTRGGYNTTVYGGDDIDVVFASNDKIYAGKGNDIMYGSNSELHFKNGDGHDTVIMENVKLYFDDATDISNLNIGYDTDDNLMITYNDGQDSVQLTTNTPYQIIIKDNTYDVNGSYISKVTIGDNTFDYQADTVYVILNGETYAPTDKATVITGYGKVSGLKSDDKLIVENETYSRTNNGGLFVDNIEVTDFIFDGEHNINVNDGDTSGMTLNVVLSDDFEYTTTGYAEVISGYGAVVGINNSDKLSISGELKYDRIGNSDDVTISGSDGNITVKDFFLNGDININNSTSEDATINVVLDGETYSATDYAEIISGTGVNTINNISANDIVEFSDVRYENLSFVYNSDGQLVISNTNGDSITINSFLDTNFDNIKALDENNELTSYYVHSSDIEGLVIGTDNADTLNATKFDTPYYQVLGYGGDDIITISKTVDNVDGGEGNDTINIESTGRVTDTIYGGTDNDEINVVGTANIIDAGAGDDTINISGEIDTLYSGEGNNEIVVSGVINNDIYTGKGKNTITIEEDAEVSGWIYGGNGDDIVRVLGTVGVTVLSGDGNDNIYVSGNANAVSTGNGNDIIDISGCVENVYGGEGEDTIIVENEGKIKFVCADAGNDDITIYGNVIATNGEGGNDNITVYGNSNTISCGAGNDEVYVQGYAGTINCNSGKNIITVASNGAIGSIINGTGSDTIIFSSNYSNLFPYINAYKDGSFDYDLYIINKLSNTTTNISNYFQSAGRIESIITNNGTDDTSDDYYLDTPTDTINVIKEELEAWLCEKNYDSVYSAIQDGLYNQAEISAICGFEWKEIGQ